MPDLEDISYSQEETITTVLNYYHFLAKMYLPDLLIVEPPEGGWPEITQDNLGAMKKTDEVIELLRHLPYIRNENDGVNEAHAAPHCHFANWAGRSTQVAEGRTNPEDLKLISEGVDTQDNVPPHVVGLTLGGRDNPIILLDTELGTVHWLECPGEIRYEPLRQQVSDDPYDYAPEEEAEWRADAPAWAVVDFFEELKARFRKLDFVPIGPRKVRDAWTPEHPSDEGLLDLVRGVYREHQWPDIEQFDKRACQKSLRVALKDRYPDQLLINIIRASANPAAASRPAITSVKATPTIPPAAPTTAVKPPTGNPTPGLTQPDVFAKCSEWHLVVSDNFCQKLTNHSKISLASFCLWDPFIGGTCINIWPGYHMRMPRV